MVRIKLEKGEHLYFAADEKICVANTIELDRENHTVRVMIIVDGKTFKDKTYPTSEMCAMREIGHGEYHEAPIEEFDFLDEF